MSARVFTIGHGRHAIGEFLRLLALHDIELLGWPRDLRPPRARRSSSTASAASRPSSRRGGSRSCAARRTPSTATGGCWWRASWPRGAPPPIALPACAPLERKTIEHVRDRLIAGGRATASEIDRHLENVDAGVLDLATSPMISAWGRRP
jgi:hypothetical protein